MMAMDLPLNAVAHESAGARKAALVLHGLGAEDRRWVLSHLPAPQLEAVRPLLAELSALGLPADGKLVEELLGSHRTAAAISGQEPFALAQAAAADLVQVVAEEPAGAVATLLNVRAWPWQDEFLALLSAPRRRHVEEALAKLQREQEAGARTRATALEAALVHEVATRIENLPQREQPRRTGWAGLQRLVFRRNP